MTALKEFQSAAVARICERFAARQGSRRFLLADEVGLGKTMVARGVLDHLCEHNEGSNGLVCVYLCSNLEIAEQNRNKLSAERASDPATRLTLITLRAKAIHEARRRKKLQLFLFTPGTSLKLGAATGIKSERLLLLACLYHWRRGKLGAKLADWTEFFRCSAGQRSPAALEKWARSCSPGVLRSEVAAILKAGLYRKLIRRWNRGVVGIRYQGGQESRKSGLLQALYHSVGELATSAGDGPDQRRVRRNRNAIIGELRKGLAEAALEFLAPDLILVDEFQRFKDVIELAGEEGTLAHRLFNRGRERTRVLILSATPYKAVTFDHEKEDHYRDFQLTLSFLLGDMPNKTEWLKEVNGLLLDFKNRLTGHSVEVPALLEVKDRIERLLKEVMCRTERNRYLLDEHKGVEEYPRLYSTDALPVPTSDALAEFVSLRAFLSKNDTEERPLPSIMDFWKSCSSIITFMDSGYALTRHLKKHRVRIDARLLRPESELAGLSKSNLKLDTLSHGVRAPAGLSEADSRRWRFLWTRPAYMYYRDDFFGDTDPTKFLVFSRWRFVPKAIAFAVSGDFEPTAKRRRKGGKQALELNSESLKVCMPFMFLADLVDPAGWAADYTRGKDQAAIAPTLSELRRLVRGRLRERFRAAGIRLERKGRKRLFWPALFELERLHLDKAGTLTQPPGRAPVDMYRLLAKGIDPADDGESANAQSFLDSAESWFGIPQRDLKFPSDLLEDAVNIALASPAVCVLRAVRSLWRDVGEDDIRLVMSMCFGQLRTYLNKGYVQEIVGRHSRSGRYSDQVLRYCADAHFQAMIDEYAYLVRRVLQRNEVESLLDHLGRVLALGAGTPNINVPTGSSGRIKEDRAQRPVNFAMAFGEESLLEETEEARATRKTSVRESFNSPFWPFVLATTSIGQEGLDFHLYCRDVMHWNLPSNPVDLEQREGRITRFDGLVVRRNIRMDYPLCDILPSQERTSNLWDRVFEQVEVNPTGNQRFKHGLYPHWVFEPVRGGKPFRIRRHLAIFEGSRDRVHYERLKRYLYYYRLAFGQARQQDLLDKIVDHPDEARLRAELQSCMVNLSPFPEGYSWKKAQRDAIAVMARPADLRAVLEESKALSRERSAELQEVGTRLEGLWQVAEKILAGCGTKNGNDSRAIAALIYLLNPYDDKFDGIARIGLQDDVDVIRALGQ